MAAAAALSGGPTLPDKSRLPLGTRSIHTEQGNCETIGVLALHPNQVKAARDRFRASGGKSDRFDRFVVCELARTDRHRFRLLEPDSDETKALRPLTRGREDLVAAKVALANRLRAELERFWPGPIGLSRIWTVGSRSRLLTVIPARSTRGFWARSAWLAS